MIAEVFKYREVTKALSDEIRNSPFRVDYIVKKIGMSSRTFYRKLRLNTFTPEEIIEILFIIKPKEAHEYQFEISLKESLEDVKHGRVIDHEEMKKRIMKKYENQVE